jgi:hypothetical protein
VAWIEATLPASPDLEVRPRRTPRPSSCAPPATVRPPHRLLASDLLEGRAPGTRGGRLAAAYIVRLLGSVRFSLGRRSKLMATKAKRGDQ